MTKIRIGVVGTGYLGSLHAKLYNEIETCCLEAICDIDKTRTDHLCAQLKTAGTQDYRTLFGKIDAVSIVVPTQNHYAIAKDFINAGIHCLIEKPFTQTVKQADTLIELAHKKNVILQVGHVERFNSAFIGAQKYFHDPFFIECHRLSHFPNRSLDVGVVLDLMIHDIDIILGLVKSEIKRVDAVGVNVLTQHEDIANARITFKNGCVCNLTASRISDETVRKIRIFLKDAYISLDYKNEMAHLYRKTASGITKEDLPIEREQPLKKELAAFIACVSQKKQPIVTGQVARDALAVALTIRSKIWKNKKIS